ncbi:ABC transporter ATP-binding protein [Paradesulfitobacterium ferrireducens]|uniref:ABC transporter ATP-binding protein n=1 Tax=Paradesulfitobacterium ferrireducens TaxID=2816476 RepID=UPI001A9009F2|nr:ABC transporter ATP-binding protein [Paradesulfitobacterium ferrireducens]
MLALQGVSKSYPEYRLPVLDPIDLEIESGQFVSLIGPSGCGKSTLCNLIAGLEQPDGGTIMLNGRPIQGSAGNVGYMPQKDLLLPWRTLLDNLILGSEVRRQDKKNARSEALVWLKRLGLDGFSSHYPQQLSGGMRQRAALIRTILFGQDTLLLDEPFGALDALTRRQMQEWLLALWQETRHTVLFITHDIEEAMLLSDRIIVLSQRPGKIVKDVSVPFPRPRHPDILLRKEAIKLKKELLELLSAEVKDELYDSSVLEKQVL